MDVLDYCRFISTAVILANRIQVRRVMGAVLERLDPYTVE